MDENSFDYNASKTENNNIKIIKDTPKKCNIKYNKKIIIFSILIIILISFLISRILKLKNKIKYNNLHPKTNSWVITGGLISYLLNERKQSNKERLFIYKEDTTPINNIKEEINIAMALDEKFIYPTLVSMASALENNNKEKHIIIYHLLLSFNFNTTLIDIFESLKKKYEVKINYYIIPNFFSLFRTWTGDTFAIYYKLFIPMIFNDYERILFIDSDSLVFKDIYEMYNLPFNDNYVIGYISHDAKFIDKFLKNVTIYINVGVLLFNIKKIRSENKDFELIQYNFENNENLAFPEQDAINVVFFQKIGIFPLKYGIYMYDISVFDERFDNKRIRIKLNRNELINAINNPSVVHFSCCTPKVWHNNSINYFGRNYICEKYHNLFYYYANKTHYYSEIYKKYIK